MLQKGFFNPRVFSGSLTTVPLSVLHSIAAALSEVEVLQVYSAQCACEQVKILFGEIHRAVQGALQAGRQAGVCREQRQLRERRRCGGDGGVPLLGERRFGPGLVELQGGLVVAGVRGGEWVMVSRGRGAGHWRQRLAIGAAQTASLLRRGLRIVPAVTGVGGRRWIRAALLALRLPGARCFQRLAGVRRGCIGAFERLEAARLGGVVASAAAVPVVRLALVFHPPILEPNFDLPLGQIQKGGDLNPPGPTKVLVEVELFLQLQQLRVGVGGAQPAGPRSSSIQTGLALIWAERENKIDYRRNLSGYFLEFLKKCSILFVSFFIFLMVNDS